MSLPSQRRAKSRRESASTPLRQATAAPKTSRRESHREPHSLSDGFRGDLSNAEYTKYNSGQATQSVSNFQSTDTPSLNRNRSIRTEDNTKFARTKRRRVVYSDEDTSDDAESLERPSDKELASDELANASHSDEVLPSATGFETTQAAATSPLSADPHQSSESHTLFTPSFAEKKRFNFSSSPRKTSPQAAEAIPSRVRPHFIQPVRPQSTSRSHGSIPFGASSPLSVTQQPKPTWFKASKAPDLSSNAAVSDPSSASINHLPTGIGEMKHPSVLPSILPEAFSPHRRKDRFQPDGWASQVRGWVIKSSTEGTFASANPIMSRVSSKVIRVVECCAVASRWGNCVGFTLVKFAPASSKAAPSCDVLTASDPKLLLVGAVGSRAGYSQSLDAIDDLEDAKSVRVGSLVRLGRIGWDIELGSLRNSLAFGNEVTSLGVCADWRLL